MNDFAQLAQLALRNELDRQHRCDLDRIHALAQDARAKLAPANKGDEREAYQLITQIMALTERDEK